MMMSQEIPALKLMYFAWYIPADTSRRQWMEYMMIQGIPALKLMYFA